MGMHLSLGILTADIHGSPIFESKSQQARTWKEEHSNIKITSTRVVTVSHHQRDPKNLQTNLERIPSLRSAFCICLWNDYSNFDPTDGDKPYDRLPQL